MTIALAAFALVAEILAICENASTGDAVDAVPLTAIPSAVVGAAVTFAYTIIGFAVEVVALMSSPNVNGSPVDNDGIKVTFGSFKSRSSSALLFLLLSPSTKTIGISSPEFHSSSPGCMSIVAKSNPTRTVAGVSL